MTVIFVPSTTLNLEIDIQITRVVCESAVDKVIIGDDRHSRCLTLQDDSDEFTISLDFHDGSPFGVFESISFENKDWPESMTVLEFRAYLESL